MKKLFAIFSVFALAMAVSVPSASAYFGGGHFGGSDTTVINENHAAVVNNVGATSNTGKLYTNSAALGVAISGISTGKATAANDVQTQANYNEISVKSDCGCLGLRGDNLVVNKNGAFAFNNVNASANTGMNMTTAHAGLGAVSLASTGNAVSGNSVLTVLNTNTIKVSK